jgi:hypothetical protein
VRAHQVAHRFVGLVWHPHGGQFVGTVQARQGHGVAPIGLDPVARAGRGERGGHHRALVAELGDLPVDGVAAGTGLVAEPQPLVALRVLGDQALDGVELVDDRAGEADLAVTAPFGERHGDLLFVYIETDEKRILTHGSSPVCEARHRPGRCNPRHTHRGTSHRSQTDIGSFLGEY